MCLFLCSTFWKPSGSILTEIVGFFNELFTWGRIYFPFKKCSFRYHANMSLLISLFMCRSKVGTWLLVCLTTLAFRLSSAHFFTTLRTHFGLQHPIMAHLFTVLVWSYHWWFRYAFASVPMWEWTFNNPRHISGYYCNYCFRKWNICLEGVFPPFLLPHSSMSGYSFY
jgi:hypothetical protein